MDENDFMKAFMGVDLLKVEGVSKTIGRVIAKLREGMVEGGMAEQAADDLISDAFRSFLIAMSSMLDSSQGQS